MRSALSLPRVTAVVLTALFALEPAGSLGCAGDRAAPAGSTLSRHFPQQAPEVLAGPAPFVAGDAGFAVPAERSPRVRVTLPSEGGGIVRLSVNKRGREGDGPDAADEVRVREIGMSGPGSLAGGSVAYGRAGGRSYWTAVQGGVEEWLHLDAGVAKRGQVVAAWEVEGARLRQTGAVVEVVQRGWVRLRVSAERAFAIGGRAVSAHLTVNGTRLELSVDADGEEVLVDPGWVVLAPLPAPLDNTIAATLPGNKVLVAGGSTTNNVAVAATQIYTVATNTWAAAASMNYARSGFSAVTLGSGKILVVGGAASVGEVYDPVANTWTNTGPTANDHNSGEVALLLDGKVLAASTNGGSMSAADVYDPTTSTWTATGAMGVGRFWGSGTTLQDGKVLVAGGYGGSGPVATAELYDPALGTWSLTGSMTQARYFQTAALMANGQVLICGGDVSSNTVDIFDPTTGTFTAGPTMLYAHENATETLLSNGMVLLVGGDLNEQESEVYDPVAMTWTDAGMLMAYHDQPSAALLPNGDVIVFGGNSGAGTPQTDVEIYTPATTGIDCANNGECASGFCVDGVCCNVACTLPCQACTAAKKGSGSDGTCGDVPAGTDPNDGCVTQAATTCGTTGTCGAGGSCALYAAGTTCGAGSCMGTTMELPASACDGKGTCTAGVAQSCGNYVCSGTACMTNCKLDANCAATAYCDGGICVPRSTLGATCSAADQCTSGFCVDGVCCNTACAGICQACTAAKIGGGMDGTCGSIAAGTDPDDECVAQASTTCGTTGSCSGVGTCALYPSTTICVAPTCSGTTLNPAQLCDGNGVCAGGGKQSCLPTTCVAGACSTACTTDTDCTTGSYCDAGICTAQAAIGTACTATDVCLSGFCVNGVCCSSACSGGACEACSVAAGAATDGTCAPLTGPSCNDGNACTKVDTCEQGACVGQSPVVCVAMDACHVAGTCNPTSGVCSNPLKPMNCPPAGPCTLTSTCDTTTGACVNVSEPDYSLCTEGSVSGVCIAGTCLLDGTGSSTSSGSSSATGSSSSGSTGSGSGSTGTGAGAGTSVTSGGAGGTTGSSGSAGGSGGAGAGLVLQGGGCSTRGGGTQGNEALLVGVGLLLTVGRRRARRAARASS